MIKIFIFYVFTLEKMLHDQVTVHDRD